MPLRRLAKVQLTNVGCFHILLDLCFDLVIYGFYENFYDWVFFFVRHGSFTICEPNNFVNVNYALPIIYVIEILIIVMTRDGFSLRRYDCFYMLIFLGNYDTSALSRPWLGFLLTRVLAEHLEEQLVARTAAPTMVSRVEHGGCPTVRVRQYRGTSFPGSSCPCLGALTCPG